MAVRKAQAVWSGTLREGKGTMSTKGSEFPFSFSSRFDDEGGANPEELLGAAHAGCYTMALNAGLERAGFLPNKVETSAQVYLEKTDAGFSVTRIVLDCVADVPGIDEATFQEHANKTKEACIISRALASVPTELNAKLVQ